MVRPSKMLSVAAVVRSGFKSDDVPVDVDEIRPLRPEPCPGQGFLVPVYEA